MNNEKVNRAMEEWKQSLITYVVGNSPTIVVIERYITHQVNTVSKCKVYYHNNDYFIVMFSYMDDRNELLYSRPHMLNNCTIIVKTWSANFGFTKKISLIVPIWVKHLNLPVNYYIMDSLSRISSGLGICNNPQGHFSHLRIILVWNFP